MSSSIPESVKSGFAELVAKNYAAQAKWFLNAFWHDGMKEEAEQVWDFAQAMIKQDDAGESGNELDEFESHRFLEMQGATLTVLALRRKLREIDLDFNGKMALTEFLLFHYNKDVVKLVTAAQGSNTEAVAKAQADLDEVNAKLELSQAAQAKAVEAQKLAEAAEAEVAAAVAALKAEEEAYHGKIAELEAKSTDQSIGIVKRNRAAAELAQLKSEDPLPLRRAKITQEAALRKSQKATAAASAARAEADAAVDEVLAAVRDAEAALEEIKQQDGTAEGTMWYMQRELEERKKYLPQRLH